MKNKWFYTFGAVIILGTITQFDCQRNITKKYPPVETKTTIDAAIEDYEEKHGETPESKKTRILQKYFTKEAFEKLKDVPIYEGETFQEYQAHALGRNFFMNCGQSMLGYGWGMKTVIADEKTITDELICHEYTHHASALGIIDDKKFSEEWNKMFEDEKYKLTTEQIDETITEKYPALIYITPKWRTMERESKLTEKIIFEKTQIPAEMKKVYEKMLKF